MLSKVLKSSVQQLTNKTLQPFSIRRTVFDFVYKDDKSDPNYLATFADPRRPITGTQPKSRSIGSHEVQTTKLSNGVTVVTESSAFPSTVDVSVLLDVGTRDETNETSGSLLSIQNTYLKTILNTNETINYGIVQMSGGSFEMDYDQESTYFHASSLQHDVVDVFSMVADCALEPRSVVAAEVGQAQNSDSHKLDQFLKTGEQFNDAVFTTAFGLKGLGLPLKGLKGNVGNLSTYTLQKFQLENITPNRIFVAASGVESHQEFVDLVGHKLSYIPSSNGQNTKQRESSTYIGGEVRNFTEENNITVALYFQGVNWTSSDAWALQIASNLLSGSRLRALLSKKSYLDTGAALNSHFTDSGLFGLRLTGAASNSSAILEDTISSLKGIASSVSSDELQRAKSILKYNILSKLENQTDRLEEIVKNVRSFGQDKSATYLSEIDRVTADQVSNAVASIINGSAPTFVAWGGQANKLKSFDAIRNGLK